MKKACDFIKNIFCYNWPMEANKHLLIKLAEKIKEREEYERQLRRKRFFNM